MTYSLMRPPGGQIERVPFTEHFSRLAAGWIYLGPAPAEEEPVPEPAKPKRKRS